MRPSWGTLCGVQEIAGYPIVRRLSSTESEERAIGRAAHGGVLIRRLSEPIPPALERAIEAHAAAGERPHVACLRDLAMEQDGSLVVVTDLVTGPSIRELMAMRAWQLGHAVTLLIPLISTLADLHEAGITLGRLDIDSVRVDGNGAPVIVDWSEAVATPPLPRRLREKDAHYVADGQALAQVVSAIADILPVGEGARLREILEGLDADAGGADSAGAALIERLFALADPLPLQQSAPRALPATPVPAHHPPQPAAPLDRSRSRHAPEGPSPHGGTITRVAHAVGLPPALVGTLEGAVAGVAHRLQAVRSRAARLSRRRLVVLTVATALGLALTIATVLDRGGAGDAVTLVESPGGDEVMAGDPGAGLADGIGGEPAATASQAPSSSALDLPDPQDEEWASIVVALASEWDRCARALERLCDTALHRESAAADKRLHDEDHDVLTRLRGIIETAPEVLVTERMGAAVILEVSASETTATSLLLMRSEAGWRVRDVLD